jgi:hypothetical protein
MRDAFDWDARFGPLGRLADALFVERQMRLLLEARGRRQREAAETDERRRWLEPQSPLGKS